MRYVCWASLLILAATFERLLAECPTAQGYQFSSLNFEFVSYYSSSTSFHINLCGSAPSCSGSSGCYSTGKGDPVSLGDVTSVDTTSDKFLNITMTSEDTVTHITMLCSNTLGRPEVQLVTEDHIFIVWESIAGCRDTPVSHHVPCYTYTDKGVLYDIGDLVGQNYHIPVGQGGSVYFSVCGPVTGDQSCNGGGACYKSSGGSTNIGSMTHAPYSDKDGVVLQYIREDSSSASCPVLTTTILLMCSPHQQSTPLLLYNDKECTYSILWRTDHACPVQPVNDVACKVQARGISYDLSPLADQDYTVTFGDHSYTMAVCGNIKSGCNGEPSSGCMSNVQSLAAWSMGSYHQGNLVWDDTGLTLILNGGTSCSSGQVRSTKILFVCDTTVGVGSPEMTEEEYCFYSFIWRTRHACPAQKDKTCSKYGTDGEHYDISLLSYNTWHPIPLQQFSQSDDLVLSVCGEMPECPGASLCRKKEDGTYAVLASDSEHFNIHKDKSLELMYEGAGECESQSTSLTVEMTCRQSNTETAPLIVSSSPCSYLMSWETAAACPSHPASGDHCRLSDPITGLTFDINSLAEGIEGALIQGQEDKSLAIQICGELSQSTCGTGVSVCRNDGKVMGYADREGRNSSMLTYDARSLSMTLVGEACNEKENYQTVIEFVCNSTTRKVEAFEIGCAYYVVWSHPSVCPMYPMECALNNDTHSYDLSPLYELGNLEWAGQLNGTQTALYVRSCGQVELGTEQCDHTAGVCAVMEVNGTKVSRNLGRASSDLQISGDVITETYHNGDRVCRDKNLRATTRVEYKCSKDYQTVIEQALFNEEMCLYVIVISSMFGCVEKSTTSHNCSITDSTTGMTFDFSFLTSDFSFVNGNSNFFLHVCGAVNPSTGCKDSAGACEVVNGNRIALGDSATSTLTLEDDVFTLLYTGGDECTETREGRRFKETQLNLICNKDVTEGTPRYINKDGESCVYHFEMELAAACRPQQPTCRVIDEQLREYDLSMLRRQDSWRVWDDTTNTVFYINVCGGSKECGGDSAACKVHGDTVTSLGRVSGEPRADTFETGVIYLTYYHGDACGTEGKLWTTSMVFICETQSESLPTISVDESSCRVSVEWRTLHACPATYTTGDNCTVNNPVTGVQYDLWELSNRVFHGSDKDHTYDYSFCSPLPAPCNGETSGGACQRNKQSGEEKSMGNVNRTLTYSNGAIILDYTDGTTCSNGDIRETRISMVCDHSLSDVEVVFSTVNETSHCVYDTIAFSGLPCDKEVLSKCEVEGYDIAALSLTRDNYYATNYAADTTFSLNVCRGLNSPSPCSHDTAICMRRGTQSGISLGKVDSAELVYEDTQLKLVYTGADLCPTTGQPYKSYINFYCSEDDSIGSPEYLSNISCSYHFIWRTRYACKDRVTADHCKLLDTISGETILDLSELKGQWTTHQPEGEGTITVGICEAITDTSCKKDSAVCMQTASTHTSLGIIESDTKISRPTEEGPVTLSYNNGDICKRNDGTSTPHRSVVEFTCSRSNPRQLAALGQDDCVTRFALSSDLVCKEEKVSCTVVKDGNTIDLSPLASTPLWITSSSVTIEGTVFVSLCSALPETLRCKDGAAACLQRSDNLDSLDLGHVSRGLDVTGTGVVELLYTGGSACPTDNSRTLSTRITFLCDKTATSVPKVVSVDNCEYGIEWETDLVCPEDVTPVSGCSVSDRQTGYIYDLKRLTRNSEFYQVTKANSKYLVNVCGTVDSCGTAGACVEENGQKVSLGTASSIETRLTDKTGEVVISYTGGDSCPNGDRKRSAVIEIMCCSASENELNLIDTDGCAYHFTLCSPYICQFDPKECDFKLGADVYDFSPLSRRHDNWVTVKEDRTFYLNPCRGINPTSDLHGCNENSIACMKEQGVSGSRSLGMIETRVQDRAPANESQILLTYSAGSEALCSRGARTEITFSCGNTLGKPIFTGERDCTYRFAWESFVACKESSKPVSSNSLIYEHPLSHARIDLSKAMPEEYFLGNSTLDLVYFSVAETLPGTIEHGACKDSNVCFKDLRSNRIVKFKTAALQLYARDESAELLIRSTTRCEDSSTSTWKGIVEYTCDDVTSAHFRAISHCHVLVGVTTPIVCSDYAGQHTRHFVSLMTALILIMSFIFGMLLLLYVCLNSSRRSRILRKIRALLPVRGARSQTLAYKRVVIDLKDTEESLTCDF